MKKYITIFFAIIFLLFLGMDTFGQSTTIYLLRHAEPTFPPYKETPPNPFLNEAGKERAMLLAKMLTAEKITHVFSTDFRRTQSTVEPLAKSQKLSIQSYDPYNLENFAKKIKTLKGKIVVVGHSDTTPKMVELLGGNKGEHLRGRYDFDRLYILQISPIQPTITTQLRYGTPHEPLTNFYEDFETDLSKWHINNPEKIRIIDSKDPQHGQVLEMHVGGPNTFALIKDSNNWNGVVVEGDVLFPEDAHNYLGFIYNYQVNDTRADYGCIYIKGNSNYVRVNPHRDGHVSRILYDEYRTSLTGKDSITIGKWQHFKAEVKDSICHFYVGDMKTPKITFPYFEFSSGKIGFEPRVIGSEVWIDNISVKPLANFTYQGFQPENIDYKRAQFLTDWQAIGPFRERLETIEKEGFSPNKTYSAHLKNYQWQTFATDGRGCVVGGKILEWTSQKNYAYFHTKLASTTAQKATLHFSTTNHLTVWLNDQQVGEIEGKFKAWYDCLDQPKHAGQQLEISLEKGDNNLMILEKGMGWKGYAGDGFFVALKKH